MSAATAFGLWDTFRHRLIITADLVCVTGLRVGAGASPLLPTATDLPVVMVEGRPYIPGSSLRGVLRAHIERMVRTLEPGVGGGQGACDPLNEPAWCIPRETMRNLRGEARKRGAGADDWLAQQVWERSCRVCRVFGSPWLASRVRIADLFSSNGARPVVRDGVAIDREKEAVRNKFDFEVVPPGTRFGLEIVAENLAPEERGLLWLGLRELEAGRIAVGGFRGRGLGRVALEGLRARYVDASDPDALRRYLLKGEMREATRETLDQWLEALLQRCGGGEDA
ncbi:MAG: type III CRISPR-associated RAMP protein Csx7 [Desulfotomaculales bacterium]